MSTDTNNGTQDSSPAAVLERIEEAIIALDPDWTVQFVNQQAADIFEREIETLLGNSIWDVFTEPTETAAYDEFHEAMETRELTRFDMYYEPTDTWFTVRVHPGSDGLTVVCDDSSQERERHREVERQQRLFEAVFRDTEDALVIADTDRRITDFNPAAERLFGYGEAEIRGRKSAVLYADETDYAQQGEERFNEQAGERHDEYVLKYERADGTIFEGETNGTSLKIQTGETIAFLGAIRDVSARAEHERLIEARNQALRSFHEITTDRTRTFEERLDAVLELGTEHLDLEVGILAAIEGQEYTVDQVVAPDEAVESGATFALGEPIRELVVDGEAVVSFDSASAEEYDHNPAAREQDIESYLGAPVVVDGASYGTLDFSSSTPRGAPFTESEETFVGVLAQWVGKELSRRQQRERAEANRDRLRQIIDMLPQRVFAKDESGEFLLVNEQVAEAYGTTVEDLEGATDADFADSQEQVEQFRADDRAVIESGEAKHIPAEPLTTADGQRRILETTKIPYDPVETDGDAVLGVSTDITELKEREAELEIQSAAMEASMDGISILNAETEYIYMNQAHAEVFGYDPETLVGSTWQRVYGEDEIERIETEVLPVLERDGEWRGETVGKRRDGTPVHQEITLSLLDDGKLICTNRDITERKAHERELERQRSRLQALFDDSPTSIIVHDAEGSILDANETQVETLGHEKEELLSMNVAEFEVGFSQEELQAVWADVAIGDTLKVEGKHRRSNGSIFPVEVWVAKTEVGDEARFVAVSRDITERKTRERELIRNREFLQKSQESAAIGGWEVDFRTDELRWTDEVHRIHELPLDEEVSFEEGLDFYHPEDKSKVSAAFERLQNEGEPYDLELRIVTATDDVRWVRTIGDPQFEDGDVVSARGVFQDITERKQREQELEELTERLDLAVRGANLGVWDWDIQTDDVTFNEQWAAMLGLSLAEVEPTIESWEERVHPDDMAHVEAALEAHMAGEADLYDCEHRMLTASGDWKWIRDVGEVVERNDDGEPARAVGIHIDITEQKEIEQSLAEERDMFAQGPAVVFKWRNDEGWPVEYVSDNVSETLGYTPEELESGTVPYETLIHEDDADRVAEEVAKQTDETTERFSHDPYRMVTASGEVRWVKDNTKIIRTDGDISHYLGYLIDITERKQLEESLRESEQSLRKITDIASDTDRDFESKLQSIMELGCERLDLPYGFLTRIEDGRQHIVEATGTHQLLQPGDSAPLSKAYCRKTIERENIMTVDSAVDEGWSDDPAYEAFGLGCYIGGKVIVEGETYGTLCFAGDENLTHTFDESESAFVELLVQWISYEIASDSVETKLRDLNETAQRLMSTAERDQIGSIAVESAQSVLGLPETGIWWHNESADALIPAGMAALAESAVNSQPRFESGEALAWQAFETGETLVFNNLETVEGRYNEDTPLRSEIIVPLGDHGVLISGSVERRGFSETDLSLLEVLSATVEEALYRAKRETELREMQEQLQQSNEELEQFAYAASHDLQEPLRTVSSYLTLLERRNRDDLDEDALEFIEIAVDGADRMREMIQALLEYSRVDTRSSDFEETEMANVFDQVARNLEVTIDETNATVDAPESGTTVAGDKSQLVQLFQNLVDNGIKYSEGDPRVDISVQRRDSTVEYAVSDDGIGMEPDQLDGIFEVFQRLHTREQFDGTGIGLSVCRKIVDRHDGDIRVDSTPGTGSTFHITLPVSGEPHE